MGAKLTACAAAGANARSAQVSVYVDVSLCGPDGVAVLISPATCPVERQTTFFNDNLESVSSKYPELETDVHI